jgi:hypothetical protein
MRGIQLIKFGNAQQAKLTNNYKNIKVKLHSTNASIWFNKICKLEQLTPTYVHVTVNGNDPRNIPTMNATIRYCLNQELKYLHKKKVHSQCTIVQLPSRMCYLLARYLALYTDIH